MIGLFDSRATAAASSIASNINLIITGGYANYGDQGAAYYARALSGSGSPVNSATPSFAGQGYFDTSGLNWWFSTGTTNTSWTEIGNGLNNWGFQSADGAYWLIVNGDLNICMFGALRGPVAASATTAAINNAISLQGSRGGGRIFFPAGAWYATPPSGTTAIGITSGNIELIGAGKAATNLFVSGNYNLITSVGNNTVIRDISLNGYNGLSALYPTLALNYSSSVSPNAADSIVHNCAIAFGLTALSIGTGDVVIEDCFVTQSFYANVYIGNNMNQQAQAWLRRVKIDQAWPVQALPPDTDPFTIGWVSRTYSKGETALVQVGSTYYLMQVLTAGSGASTVAPTPSGYGKLTLSDGYVWALCGPLNLSGLLCDSNSFQIHAEECDFSGSYAFAIQLNGTVSGQPDATGIFISDSAVGDSPTYAGIYAVKGRYLHVSDCEISGVSAPSTEGAAILFGSSWSGPAMINDNQFYGSDYYQSTNIGIWVAHGSYTTSIEDNTFGPFAATAVLIGSNVSDVTVNGNTFNGSTVAVTIQPCIPPTVSVAGIMVVYNNWRSCTTGLSNSATLADSIIGPSDLTARVNVLTPGGS